MLGPQTTWLILLSMPNHLCFVLCFRETRIIIVKVSWRVIKSSSTIFILQIYCHAPWYLPLVLCWWVQSIRGVLVNFVSVWMKRRKLSVKRPLWLCIWGAARGSKPVFVWIKMKGFRSRLFLLQTCQKSDLRCSRGGWWERKELEIWEDEAQWLLDKKGATEKKKDEQERK